MPYQEILGRAWQIFKRHRALWLFGFLSACTGGVYGRLSLPTFNVNIPIRWQPDGTPAFTLPNEQEWLTGGAHLLTSIPPETWLLLALGLLTALLAWLVISLMVRSIADPALVRGTMTALKSEGRLSVHDLFTLAKPFFGRTVGFYLLLGGGAAALSFLFGLLFFTMALATHGIGLACLLPFFLFAVPAIWLLELYIEMALLALVVEDLPLMEAFRRGWAVLKTHFWNALLIGLLLTAIHIGVGLLFGIATGALLVMAAVVLIFGISAQASGTTLATLIGIAVLLLLGLMLVSAIVMGTLQAYLQSAWTLAYLHFTQETTDPKRAFPTPKPDSPARRVV